MPDETDSDDVPDGGRLDRTTMQTLGRRAVTHQLVDSWRFEPDRLSPRSLVISLKSTAYPASVDTARVDIHWFVTNDYYVHYVEHRGPSHVQCRWDRHPKTDAPRSHFHPPPDASGVEPSPLSEHHLEVLFTVLDWAAERVGTLRDEANRSA